jgi:hypothetical protein
MSVLDDVEEIAALHGNSEVMRFIGGGVLAVGSVSPDAPAGLMIISANAELVALRVVHDDVVDQVLRIAGASPALDAGAQPDQLGVS